jgi:hypothetical protein
VRPYRPSSCYHGKEPNKATIIDVGAGAEVTNIDIVMDRGPVEPHYSIQGRTIDADTGALYQYVRIHMGTASGDGSVYATVRSGARGEFRIDGLPAGDYVLITSSDPDSNSYGGALKVEVANADRNDVELRVHKGAVISGIVEMEGGLAADGKPPRLRIGAAGLQPVDVEPAGHFRLAGLMPMKHRLHVSALDSEGEYFLSRMESRGNDVTAGIPVRAGEEIDDVRVVVGLNTGRLVGEVQLKGGGVLPAGITLFVSVGALGKGARPDVRGRFEINGLSPGEYEVSAFAWLPQSDRDGRIAVGDSRKVSIVNRGATAVTFVLDLTNVRQK